MAPGVMLYKSHAFRKQIFTVTLSWVLRDGMTYLHPTNTGIKTAFRVETHISDLKAAAIHCKLRIRVCARVCLHMRKESKMASLVSSRAVMIYVITSLSDDLV